jgi:hypothetical protein
LPSAQSQQALPTSFFFGVTKGRSFIQTTPGAPVLETNAYSFYAFIADRSAASSLVFTASVTSPSGTVVLQPNAPGESIDNDAGAAFVTSAALDAAYPNGSYTFNFTSESDGSSSSTLDLAGNSYPGAPTHQYRSDIDRSGRGFRFEMGPFHRRHLE